MGQRVLIPQDIAQEGKDYLTEHGYEIKMGTGVTEAELSADVADCQAILLRTAEVTAKVLAAGDELKVVARHGAGYNNVDLNAASERGIWVTNAPDSTTNAVAEFTLGAIIAAAKKSFLMSRKLTEGNFYYKNQNKGTDLMGKTLAVIGLGRIGREVARKVHAGLDMEILAYDPFVKPETVPAYIRLVEWEQAFSEADFISLHMPLTKENRGCVGAREFALMQEHACLINCARGEVVDEAALLRAVECGSIGGVFTDVLEQEPPNPDHPLLANDRITVTPHMASNTTECMALMALQAAQQIHKVLSGHTPDYPVNRPAI